MIVVIVLLGFSCLAVLGIFRHCGNVVKTNPGFNSQDEYLNKKIKPADDV